MRKVLLRDVAPELAKQLVDKSLLDSLGVSSKESVLWRCEKGHEWMALVSNRYRKGYGCPYCSGRLPIVGENDLATLKPDLVDEMVDKSLASKLKLTSHMKVMWRCERGHTWEASVSSRVQKSSGCPYCSGRLAIEGETDLATVRPDLAKELVDKSLAHKLKPGTNKKVEWECSQGHRWFASPNSRVHMNSGCPVCAGKVLVKGENDLATLRPDLAEELVDKSSANELFVNSNHKVSWRCKNGHEWQATVSSRTQFNEGCPYCSHRRVLPGVTDLGTLYPELAEELVDSSLARDLLPTSHRKVRWRCKNGHEWDAIVANRVQFGYGCPLCSRTSTSFVEQILYLALKQTFSDVEVLNRDKSTFGFEVDVIIPEIQFALEFGSWYYHSSRLGSDMHKREVCHACGYKMITIYDSVPNDACIPVEDDMYIFSDNLAAESNSDKLYGLVLQLCAELGQEEVSLDWDELREDAYKFSRKQS